jgi:sarcosine oxidase subunit beta
MKSAHVVIIGGGVVGTSSAYYLAKEGVDVTLVERNEIASGASGANLGNMSLHNRMPGPILDLNLLSLGMYQSLSQELGYDIEYVNTRGLSLVEKEAQTALIGERMNRQRQAGLDVEFIGLEELKIMLPHIAKDLPGALACSQSSRINSLKVVFGYAMGARNLGARILLHTQAEAIKIYNKNVHSVITDRGEIKTRFVVIAAGAWSPPIGETAGLSIPVRPIKGNIIVTEPIPSDDMQIVAEIHNLGGPQPSTVYSHLQQKFNVRMAFSPTPPGNVLIGRSEEFAGYDTSVNYQTIRMYAGLRPSTPDDFPIVDRLHNPGGLVLATGHGDRGMNLGPITGKIVSELIVKGRTETPIHPFRFARFLDK